MAGYHPEELGRKARLQMAEQAFKREMGTSSFEWQATTVENRKMTAIEAQKEAKRLLRGFENVEAGRIAPKQQA